MFKDINGYEGKYQVNESGEVLSLVTGKVLKPFKKESGYLIVKLHKNGEKTNHFVHKLVADCFLDNENGFTEVNHIDHDKLNNHYSNLEWCTREHNIREMFKFYGTGRAKNYCKCGSEIDHKSDKCVPCYRLSSRKVARPSKEELVKLLESNSFVAVGRMFGVSDNAVRKWLKS